jgi:hypothetical protein
MATAYCSGWGQGAIDWRGGRWPPGSYNFLDLRNLNLHNTTLSTRHIPPPHLQVYERGKDDMQKQSQHRILSKKNPRTFIRLPPACLNQRYLTQPIVPTLQKQGQSEVYPYHPQ